MIKDEKFTDYKAAKNWINPSSFKSREIRTPAHYLWYKNHPEAKKESVSMAVGSAIHCRVLTPELFEKEYELSSRFMFPPNAAKNPGGGINMRDSVNRKVFASLKEKAILKGKIFLGPEQSEQVNGMYEGLKCFVNDLNYVIDRKNGNVEQSVYMFAEFNKGNQFRGFRNMPVDEFREMTPKEKHLFLPVKTRPDYWHKIKTYVADLKTTNDGSPDNFPMECWKYGYHIQAAFIIDLLNTEYNTIRWNHTFTDNDGKYLTFCLLMVENKPPYCAIKYWMKPSMIHAGREDYINRLTWIHDGFLRQEFRGYDIYSDYVSLNEDGEIIKNYQGIELDLPRSYYNSKQWRIDNGYEKPF